MFAIFYGSLEDSIPFPFLRIFQLQIPFGNDYFSTALCWVFAFCPMWKVSKISSSDLPLLLLWIWADDWSDWTLSRYIWPLQVLQPNCSHWRRTSSFLLTLQSWQPAHGFCMSQWPSLQLESLRAHVFFFFFFFLI